MKGERDGNSKQNDEWTLMKGVVLIMKTGGFEAALEQLFKAQKLSGAGALAAAAALW